MNVIDLVKSFIRDDIRFRSGDTVRVHVKVREGSRERVGCSRVVIAQHGGPSETFTVRKISNGVGVERIFPSSLPSISQIEVKRLGKVRRAKLYLRSGRKSARIKERRVWQGAERETPLPWRGVTPSDVHSRGFPKLLLTLE